MELSHLPISRTFYHSKQKLYLLNNSSSLPSPHRPRRSPFFFLLVWIWLLQIPHMSGVIQCLSLCLWFSSTNLTSLVAQLVKNLLQCRRPGFDPWVGKIPWRRKWQPTPVSCLKNPMDGGTWRATVNGVPRVRHDSATKPPPISLMFICVVAWVRIAFHYIVYHILFVIHWTFEHIRLLAVVNNAAMDSGVRIPVWVPAFNSLGYMSRGVIARSYGNYRASFVAQ